MRFEGVSILGVAHVDAPHRVTSREIDDQLAETYARLGIPAGLLENLTGVRARRFWDAGVQPSEAAALAGRAVIERSGVDPSRIGVLVNTSVCRDYLEPSVASLVHSRLGLSERCVNFDLTNACLGFLDGMSVVAHMIEGGGVDYGLVVDAESSRFVVESTVERLRQPATERQTLREQLATLTFGSGAAALILARSGLAPEGHRFLGAVTRAATQHHELCRGQADAAVTDSGNLLVHGLALASQTWLALQEELGWTAESVDQFALHQVSELHTQELARSWGFDPGRAPLLYPELGNVGPASVPMALSKALDAGRIGKGDRVVLAGIGSGLNCTAAGVLW